MSDLMPEAEMKEWLLDGRWDDLWYSYKIHMSLGFGCDFYIRTHRPNPDIPSMVHLIDPNEAGLALSLARESNEDELSELGEFSCEFLRLFTEMVTLVEVRKQHADALKGKSCSHIES